MVTSTCSPSILFNPSPVLPPFLSRAVKFLKYFCTRILFDNIQHDQPIPTVLKHFPRGPLTYIFPYFLLTVLEFLSQTFHKVVPSK